MLLFSQNKLGITILNQKKEPLSRVIVLLSHGEQQVAFGSTNTDGQFIKSLPSGTYTIALKKLGFSTVVEQLVIEKDALLTFEMLPELNQLEDVIIKARPKVMRIKGDSISYNLKAVVDGTENKIEDVINKLPGLEVDAEGKVFYKGEKINNVLIDGNEFFGNKHQMATQNINADMIEGIDLYTNYSGFAIASGGD